MADIVYERVSHPDECTCLICLMGAEIKRLKTSRDRWREMALAYRLGTLEGDNLYEEMMGRG